MLENASSEEARPDERGFDEFGGSDDAEDIPF